ncbi:XRE family transcriptional regulator [Clostridium sp. OF09-10]|nr:helix-turn-helix domain-containing protein [Clostridium sp. OF09-10]RHW02546.1 XRE family transcriptional regulator [Clostridium sp. OF09-10]
MVDYSPLWDTMRDRNITQYKILQDKVLDNHTLDRLRKGQNITLITLERICGYLNCTPNDAICFKNEEQNKNK